MDINMPKLDGVTALQIILQEKICPVVMVSSLTQQGTATTFECLELGAFDFVGKPDGTVSNNMGVIADELISKLKAAASRGIVDRLQRSRERRKPYRPPMRATFEKVTRKRAVAIGISTGGPATLQEVLPQIPPTSRPVFSWCSICHPPLSHPLPSGWTITARSRLWKRDRACP